VFTQSFLYYPILFTDFINFSRIAENITPEQLVSNLDQYFIKFDSIINKYNLEKIKTIGDAYMCAGGIPAANKSNPFTVVLAGLEIQKYMKALRVKTEDTDNPSWKLRLGIHSGELVTGVVGEKKFAYDIWGDSVNTASRIESAGEAEKVNISGSTFNIIKDYFDCSYRGKIKVKNKGEIDMYFVNRIIPEFSADKEGLEPNEKFMNYLKSLDLPVLDAESYKDSNSIFRA